MKKLFFSLLLLAPPAFGTTHPRVITTRDQWAAMIASSTVRPWSEIKAAATTYITSPQVTNFPNNTGGFGTTSDAIKQQNNNAFMNAMGSYALLFVLNSNNASSTTYKNNIITFMNKWPQLRADQALGTEGAAYNLAVSLNSAFMSMTIALDVIHDDLTAVQVSSYNLMMDSWMKYSQTVPSSWAMNNYGTYLTYHVYRDTNPTQLATSTACYHALLSGNETIFPPALCDSRQAYHGMSSEIQPLTQLNVDGISGSGASYAWARIGGKSREKLGKWGGDEVAVFSGVDTSFVSTPTYTSRPLLSNFYEWLFAGMTTPWNAQVVFGDTANNQSMVEDLYQNLETLYGRQIYFLPHGFLEAGKYSAKAQQWANRVISISTISVIYPGELIDYAAANAPYTAPTIPISSLVVRHGGAAFWSIDQSTLALQGVLSNYHITKHDHYHASDFNGLWLGGYGESLLSNVGVGSNTNFGILGFPRHWHKDDPHAGNVLLINDRNYHGKNPANEANNSYRNWNPGTPYVGTPTTIPLYGGDGILESLISRGLDYAVGLGTSQYVHRSTTTGGITENLGQNERNFMFVHADTTAGTNGYWIVVDEVYSSSGGFVNQIWHPYGTTMATTTLNQEYAWRVEPRLHVTSTTLNIFLANAPISIAISTSPFSANPAEFIGTYINAKFTVDTSSYARVVTVLYPSNNTHHKSTMTRVSGGAKIDNGTYDDYVIASAGTSTVTSQGATFQGKIAFFRKNGSAFTQYFVRQGTSFNDGNIPRQGFSSNVPLSFHVQGTTGTIVFSSTNTANVSFYYEDIAGVRVDGATVSGTQGVDVYTITLSSGNHDIEFATSELTLGLSHFWITAGGYKQPRQDLYPYVNCDTCTISRNWDGSTASFFGAKNETIGFALYMGNNTGVDISSVSVSISSFTGPTATGIVSTPVTLANTTNYTTRPIEQFYVRYHQIKGMTQLSWDGTEYEMRDVPERMRRPCTLGINGDCPGTGGTTFADRQDHDKFYPEILVPYEAVFTSSFTVSKSSSQAIWFDVFIASTLPAGAYTATITVKENNVTSVEIPVELEVKNFTLPNSPSKKSMTYITQYNINYRHQGDHFPAAGGAELVTRQHYAQMLKRHKFAAVIGENCCGACNVSQPCPEFRERLNGGIYLSTAGYGNAPGVGLPDQFFSIGTYGNWDSATWSTFTVTGSAGFCTNVSSWSTAMLAYPSATPFLYLEDEPASLANVHKWSTWMSTACNMSGSTIASMATVSMVDASVSAPNLSIPCSTAFMGASSATWQTLSAAYQTTGSTQQWFYNGHPAHSASLATEDDGISPVVNFWAMHKKGLQNWFYWSADYWTHSNTNDSGLDTNIFTDPVTFGFIAAGSDTTKGLTGFNYSNGDGVLLYPGTDVSGGSVSYGIDGPIASWRLKMIRRGIQDGDYLTMANAADPTATSAIVNTMVPDVLWEHECFLPGDCTYAYGGRSWTNNPDTWEEAREDLSLLIPDDAVPEAAYKSKLRGSFTLKGSATLK